MKVLYDAGFPVPKPIDNNRHAVLMEYMQGSMPLYQLPSEIPIDQIECLLDVIFKLLLRFATCGLIHGDFNEFNLLIDLKDVRKVTVIDFPQIISIEHVEAKEQFERDVTCIERFFEKRFRIEVEGPSFQEAFNMYLENKANALNQLVPVDEDDDLLINREDATEENGDDLSDDVTSSVSQQGDDVQAPEDSSSESESDSADLDTPERPRRKENDDIIQDPRYVLKAKRRLEQRNAPKVSVSAQPKPGRSNAKPNKQKRGQHTAAIREAKAWKAEGGW